MYQTTFSDGTTVYALQTGVVSIRQTHFQHNGPAWLRYPSLLLDPRWTADLPIWVWLLKTPTGNYLVDTGVNIRVFDADYFGDDSLSRFINRRILRLRIQPEDEVAFQLAQLGLSPDDIDAVILTHLHLDHTDGLRFFPKAAVLVAKEQWEKPYGAAKTTFPGWFVPKLIDYTTPDGGFGQAHELAAGLRIIPTPGHTFGHQSVILERDGLTVLLAGDASFTADQMMTGQRGGIVIDWPKAAQTLQTIRRFVAQTPTIYLPSHDPDAGLRLATRQFTGQAEPS